MRPERFYTHSLQDPRVGRILAAALEAVEPGAVVERYLASNPLPSTRRVFALGLGKAALPMTRALTRFTAVDHALVITKHASDSGPDIFDVMESGHPVPDARSLAAGEAALEFVSSLHEEDLLVCLISGGGSALMTAPVVPLEDMQALTSALLASGARIDEINTLRRRLDRVKGGGIARATKARVLSLILSDVVGSPLEAIASGPTAPDPTTSEAALAVLEKYKLLSLGGNKPRRHPGPTGSAVRPSRPAIPDNAGREIRDEGVGPRRGAGKDTQTPNLFSSSLRDFVVKSSETPKQNDPIFARVQNVIVGENAMAIQAALRQAEKEGFQAESLGSDWQGEAREVGVKLAQKLRVTKNKVSSPFCLIAGGETTVTLSPWHREGGAVHPERSGTTPALTKKSSESPFDYAAASGLTDAAKDEKRRLRSGTGGRNQELALAAVPELAGLENMMLISLATDGEDGPTDAAGAVINGETLRRAERLGLDVAGHLSRHDAYPFFEQLADLIKTGPTGTNVNDLVFLLAV